MQDEAKLQNLMNPLEFWKQWNEMTTTMWANAINNGKPAGMASSGFDTSWMKAMNTAQEQLANHAQGQFDPQEAWKLWLATTIDIWRDAINMGGDPLGLIANWVKVMENVQETAYSAGSLPVDPFKLFHQWYEVTSKPWSRVVEESIASERFLAFSGPFLENYSKLTSTFRRASEAYFKALRLPTLSDITRVAEMVVDLEEKVDTIEETIERVKEQMTPGAVATARITDLDQRLSQIETKLEKVLALLVLLG